MVKAYLRYVFNNLCGVFTGNSVAIIYNENQVISASGQYVIFANLKTNEVIQQVYLSDKNSSVTAIAKHNQTLAIGYQDGDVVIWDIESNKQTSILIGHRAAINDLKFQSDGLRLFSGSLDNTIIVWDIISEDQLIRLSGHTNQITQVEIYEYTDINIQNYYFLISSSKDGLLKIWDLQFEKSIETISSSHNEVPCFHIIQQLGIILIGTNSDEVLVKKITINPETRVPHLTDEGIFKRNAFSRPQQIIYEKSNQSIYILTNEKKIEVYKLKDTKKVIKRLKQKQLQPEEQEIIVQFSQQLAFASILTLPSKAKSMTIFQKGFKVGELKTFIVLSFANNSIEIREINDQYQWIEEDHKAYNFRLADIHFYFTFRQLQYLKKVIQLKIQSHFEQVYKNLKIFFKKGCLKTSEQLENLLNEKES